MQAGISSYLDSVRSHLHLDTRTEQRVISELYSHFQEKVADLQEEGLPEEEATRAALASFGDARFIAKLMYEAYSGGSWTEAFIGCQPHLIVAALFATHVWRSPVLLGAAFAAIAIIAILGWRQGLSNWLYSWMSYAILPLLIVSYYSIDPFAQTISYFLSGIGVPASFWHLAALALLFAFTLWLIASMAVVVARRDWILLSLMLLPIPVLVLWMMTETQFAGFLPQALVSLETRFSQWDGAMAVFFLLLGVATATFVRVRNRAVKVTAVILVGIVGSAIVARSLWGSIGLVHLIGIAIGLFLFLTIPLLLQSLLGHDPRSKQVLPS
jgi:hypothetical protein